MSSSLTLASRGRETNDTEDAQSDHSGYPLGRQRKANTVEQPVDEVQWPIVGRLPLDGRQVFGSRPLAPSRHIEIAQVRLQAEHEKRDR